MAIRREFGGRRGLGAVAQPGRQTGQPGTQAYGHHPPYGETEQVVARISQPCTQSARTVGQRHTIARSRPCGVLWRIAEQRQQPETQHQNADQQGQLNRKAAQPGRGGARAGHTGRCQGIERVSHSNAICRELTPSADWPAWVSARLEASILDQQTAVFTRLDEALLLKILHHTADHLT